MHKKGFTLIELLAVVLIIGILTSVALPQYRRSLERSRSAEALQMLPAIYDSLQRARVERGNLTGVGFAALDISSKGRITGNGTTLQTNSFLYDLFPSNATGFVSAQLTRGPFAGTTFFYNGSTVACCHTTNTEVHDFFNLPHSPCCTSTCVQHGDDPAER